MLDRASKLLQARENQPATAALRCAHSRARLAVTLALSAALLAVGSAMAAAKQPVARSIDASRAVGCCVCRGSAAGEQTAVDSCVDGKTVDACMAKCRGEGAASIAFGYQQACSQGCAGFPTQGR